MNKTTARALFCLVLHIFFASALASDPAFDQFAGSMAGIAEKQGVDFALPLTIDITFEQDAYPAFSEVMRALRDNGFVSSLKVHLYTYSSNGLWQSKYTVGAISTRTATVSRAQLESLIKEILTKVPEGQIQILNSGHWSFSQTR